MEWKDKPDWLKNIFLSKQTEDQMEAHLRDRIPSQLETILEFGLLYHAEDEVFWIFKFIIRQLPIRRDLVVKWMDRHPPLVFALLKQYPPSEDSSTLSPECVHLAPHILQNIIRTANSLGMASLVAIEKLAGTISQLPLDIYFDLLWLSALSVRSQQLVQEIMLVLNDSRRSSPIPHSAAWEYGHKQALGIASDRAEEAADECPCNEEGRPKRQRTPPSQTKLTYVPDNPIQIKATLRVDARTPIRLHSHVRLQAASKVENQWLEAPVLDGLVVQAMKGEVTIELMHPPPPETERMDWNMYNAGSIGGSKLSTTFYNTQKLTLCSLFCSAIQRLRGL